MFHKKSEVSLDMEGNMRALYLWSEVTNPVRDIICLYDYVFFVLCRLST